MDPVERSMGLMPNLGIRASLSASGLLSRYTSAVKSSSSSVASNTSTPIPSSSDAQKTVGTRLDKSDTGNANGSSLIATRLNTGKEMEKSAEQVFHGQINASQQHVSAAQTPASSPRSLDGSNATINETKNLSTNSSCMDISSGALIHPYSSMSSSQQEQVLLELGKGRLSSWKISIFGDFDQIIAMKSKATAHVQSSLPMHSITEPEFLQYMRETSADTPIELARAAFRALAVRNACNNSAISKALTTKNQHEQYQGSGYDLAFEHPDGNSSNAETLLTAYSNIVHGRTTANDQFVSPQISQNSAQSDIDIHQYYMTQFQFTCAVVALSTNRVQPGNATWLDLRRRILFQFYCTKSVTCNALSYEGFNMFLLDCSDVSITKTFVNSGNENKTAMSSELHPPMWHGIHNESWNIGYNIESKNQMLTINTIAPSSAIRSFLGKEKQMRATAATNAETPFRADEEDDDTRIHQGHPKTEELLETLALRNVQLAQKSNELEELQLQYRKLEKKLCGLKLELADAKAHLA